MGFFSTTEYTVTTLMIGVEGQLTLLIDALAESTERINASEGDFDIASEEAGRIAGILVERQSALTAIGNWGEVFRHQKDAASYGDEMFAECAGRYLSSGLASSLPESTPAQDIRSQLKGRHIVVMLTVGYAGKISELERTLSSREEAISALMAIRALQLQNKLMLVHIHYAPSHTNEVLTDDQLLVNYPELIAI